MNVAAVAVMYLACSFGQATLNLEGSS